MTTRNATLPAVNEPTPATARTLRELGLPGALASDLEAAFRALGATSGERVVGFTFVTPDGERHALRTAGGSALGRAA